MQEVTWGRGWLGGAQRWDQAKRSGRMERGDGAEWGDGEERAGGRNTVAERQDGAAGRSSDPRRRSAWAQRRAECAGEEAQSREELRPALAERMGEEARRRSAEAGWSEAAGPSVVVGLIASSRWPMWA
jgi:hypothetical protein